MITREPSSLLDKFIFLVQVNSKMYFDIIIVWALQQLSIINNYPDFEHLNNMIILFQFYCKCEWRGIIINFFLDGYFYSRNGKQQKLRRPANQDLYHWWPWILSVFIDQKKGGKSKGKDFTVLFDSFFVSINS